MKTQAVTALRETLFSVADLPTDCWQDLQQMAHVRRVDKGDYFARAGEDQPNLGFVAKGVFRAFVQTEKGDEYNKTFFTERTFMLTLTALVEGKTNRINIQALEESTICTLNYQQFAALYDRYPALERIARVMLEIEWSKKEQREIALVLDDAACRYARFQIEHPGLENRIPQYQVASYLGITPIHLSRIRSAGSTTSD